MADEIFRRRLLALLLVAAASSPAAEGSFVVEKSNIRVVSPEKLRSKHDGAIANFGIPRYGASMSGVVVYPSGNGCDAFEGGKTPFRSKSRRPVVLLLDRGDCLFALKVWNAQNAGAAAVLVADNVDEPLITMDTPEELSAAGEGYIEKISIPSALIDRGFGDKLRKAVRRPAPEEEEVVVKLDWRESVPHPDSRVEYELWTSSNDECGPRCDEQVRFVGEFRGHAQLLEKAGFAVFTPHYITWFCPEPFVLSKQCKTQCLNHGRYCSPDPEGDFAAGYDGRDIVTENLRQLCVHRVTNRSGSPWLWWDFVTDFHLRCSMKEKKYSRDCADNVVKSLDLPLEKIKECMGDLEADAENPVLKAEQDLQVGHGGRGDVTILPTLVINNVQYRGVLERKAVLKAVCAGFKETTEPPVCLSEDIETNECLRNNGGCWKDRKSNITACKDTFRGRVCECPIVNGVLYKGDGYSFCRAVGPGRCAIDNGGCWSEERKGQSFSACSDFELSGCRCPFGFRGDGHRCEDVDECKERLACQCEGCSCKNTWGGYDCKCKGNLLYISSEDACIARNNSGFGWLGLAIALSFVTGAGLLAGYLFYRYRLRSYMDSEIMAIMSQYMPLDNQHSEAQPLRQQDSVA